MKVGWQKANLGTAFSTATGSTPPKNNALFYGAFMPLVKPPELCDATLDSAEDGLSKEGAAVARIAPPNSILVSCIGNLGKVGLNTIPVAFNQQINAILPNENKAIAEFMFYQVLSCSFKEQLEALASGTTVPIVNKSKFNSINVVLPPLPEQQRIVAILDQAFDGIATAKANAEQNLQNARALFDSHLQAVFSKYGDEWEEKSLGQLYRVGSSKRVLKSEWKTEGVPFYRGREITKLAADGCVDNELFISEKHYAELSKKTGVPESGDIVITAIGTIGNAHIVRESDRFYFKDASVLWMKKESDVNSEFIVFWLKSRLFFNQLDRGNGATVDTLTIQKLQSMKIFIPSTKTQENIVVWLKSLYEETKHLESIYQSKLDALDELKQSLLHQAFSGQL